MKKKITASVSALLLFSTVICIAQSREYIKIVGSSTVYPFANAVADKFTDSTSLIIPEILSTGSGGGFQLFCAGIGEEYPDITNSSRRIKKSEYDLCHSNNIKDIIEVKIGYDGIILANFSGEPLLKLSKKDIFLALAEKVPDPKGAKKLISNPYKTWKDVNPSLPGQEIIVYGPPPTSGTRDAFEKLALEGGCKTISWIKSIKKKNKRRYRKICHSLRKDGAYIEAGEDDNLIVEILKKNHKVFGIFGFSFLNQNKDKIQGSFIDKISPTFKNISSGAYPVSRPLFFYVKKAHLGLIPGIEQYLAEFTREKSFGPYGYLIDKGLIPMSDEERKKYRKIVKNLEILKF